MTTSSIGSDIVSSMSIGTFNPNTIATALANAQIIGEKSQDQANQTKYKNQTAAYTTIQSALSGLKAGLGDLSKASTFSQASITSSDSSVVNATISGNPSAASYEVKVSQRAKADTLASSGFISQNTAIGTGKLTLAIGASSKDLTIDASNNSLSGIKDQINNSGLGVAASIVKDATGYRLVLTGKDTGAVNKISLSVLDEDGNNSDTSGLSKLADVNMTKVSTAQDAAFSVNGLSLTSATNQVTGVIDGVSLSLNKEGTVGSPVSSTITVGADTTSVGTAITSVIDDFNAMKSILDNVSSLSKSDTDATKGALAGDSTISRLRTQMRSMLNFKLNDSTASIQTMADIGVKTALDGTLSIDQTVLSNALSSNPQGVAKLFANTGSATSPLVRVTGATDNTIEGSFGVTINQIAKQASYLGTSIGNGNISIGNTDNSFQIAVNGTTSNTLTIAPPANSTKNEIASYLQSVINNDSNLKAKGSSVSVAFNTTDSRFEILTDKYGSASKIAISNLGSELSSKLGLADGSGDTGSFNGNDVSGSLDANGHTYAFSSVGQHVKINSYLTGSPRGLEFDILGDATGSNLTTTKGYAGGLSSKITDMLDSKNGLVGMKLTNLAKSSKIVTEQLTKLDDKYNTLVQKYVSQFTQVDALQAQMKSLSTSLTSMFSKNTSSSG